MHSVFLITNIYMVLSAKVSTHSLCINSFSLLNNLSFWLTKCINFFTVIPLQRVRVKQAPTITRKSINCFSRKKALNKYSTCLIKSLVFRIVKNRKLLHFVSNYGNETLRYECMDRYVLKKQ